MAKTITIEIPEAGAKELEIEIKHLFAEIEASNARMKRDQEEIERLKARTRQTLSDIEAMFAPR